VPSGSRAPAVLVSVAILVGNAILSGIGCRHGAPANDALTDDALAAADTRPAATAGKATYYAADGSGNCSFNPSPADLMVVALSTPDYRGSLVCGACVEVKGPDATIVVRVVDRCPGCDAGHIDLSEQAFAKIAEPVRGVVPVEWRHVACDVTGPIVYRFKEGSSQWWTAVQVRNTRYAVEKLEAKVDGVYRSIERLSYNYFVAADGLGPGPYDLRVTDVLGHVLEDRGIALEVGAEVSGGAQFPR